MLKLSLLGLILLQDFVGDLCSGWDCQTRHYIYVKPNICMHAPSSRLSNPTSACTHPVQDCQTQHLNACTQFKTLEPDICMQLTDSLSATCSQSFGPFLVVSCSCTFPWGYSLGYLLVGLLVGLPTLWDTCGYLWGYSLDYWLGYSLDSTTHWLVSWVPLHHCCLLLLVSYSSG